MKYLLLEYYSGRSVKTVNGDVDRERYKHFLYPVTFTGCQVGGVDKHKSSYSFPYAEEGDSMPF
ncbi:hypothetical protein [Symbiopectobacterium purcellii]|uniref:Uncharacterized protein n=1 Tax=Symbiopectobacterium purcellii TaxID=2871826 RepID=A0ABX9AUJ7_9ENTR|nr:hypothetical protein [Symbiopectobacterium purcellii]QZN97671.1 hypothetical protein K6K13_10350 [Symbiopectobacterium purcellii]